MNLLTVDVFIGKVRTFVLLCFGMKTHKNHPAMIRSYITTLENRIAILGIHMVVSEYDKGSSIADLPTPSFNYPQSRHFF